MKRFRMLRTPSILGFQLQYEKYYSRHLLSFWRWHNKVKQKLCWWKTLSTQSVDKK